MSNTMKTSLALISAVLLIVGCTLGPRAAKKAEKISAEGLGNALEEKVKVSSYNFEKPPMNATPVGGYDYFFRAYIDKATYETDFQLYVRLNSAEWMFWDRARYDDVAGRKVYEVAVIGRAIDACFYGPSLCEDIVFSVSREQIIAWSKDGGTVRFSTTKKIGPSCDVVINAKEAAAFVQQVDGIRAEMGWTEESLDEENEDGRDQGQPEQEPEEAEDEVEQNELETEPEQEPKEAEDEIEESGLETELEQEGDNSVDIPEEDL